MTRAVCEVCGAVQPPDWRPGDLCVQCGSAVRRDSRCHWCARLTPDGLFCRHCGSELVQVELYGAARMLKAAGVDHFSLPERLAGLPPAQRDQFSRLYAPHAQMAERHLDDLDFVTARLRGGAERQGGWAAALEDALLPLLPLPPDQLAALTLPPVRGTGDLERLAEIRDGTPFAQTAHLAALASVRCGAPYAEADAVRAAQALRSPDRALQTEAALALADWRHTALQPYAVQPGELRDALQEVYLGAGPPEAGRQGTGASAQRTADRAQAGLGLSLLAWHYANVRSVPVPDEVLRPLLASGRPDLAFGAALVLADTDRLLAALRVPEQRTLAAVALARLGVLAPLAPVLPLLTPDDQARVLHSLDDKLTEGPQAGGALLPLRAALLPLLNQHQTRRDATRLLLVIGHPEDALPLIAADLSRADTVLRQLDLSEHEAAAVCARLLGLGGQAARLSGLSAVRERVASGRFPEAFVPEQFGSASGEGRRELLALARLQLAARGDAGLHRFLWRLVERGAPDETREPAWSVLSGWYGEYGRELRLSVQGARHFFGGVGPLVERLCAVAEDPELLSGFFSSFSFLNLLGDPNPDVLPAVREADADGRLNRALLALARREDVFAPHRAGAVRLLGLLARPDDAAPSELRAALASFLHPDAPWQVQRAALAALYPAPQAQAERLAEWKAQKAQAQTYAERAPLDDLIYQLEQVMSGSDR